MKHAVAAVLLGAVALHAGGQTPSRDNSPRTQATSHAFIRGRIVAGDTDSPVSKARVTLVAEGGGSEAPPRRAAEARDPIYSDADGRFEFSDVPAGRYTVSAWKSGFAHASFGARSPLEPPIPVVARAGRATDEVAIRLMKGAAVSGRVTDEFGEAMAGWSVTVGRPVAVGGRLRLESATPTTQTDDLGEYRVGGLPAGKYVVSAFGIGPFQMSSEAPGAPPRMGGLQRRLTFHPDVQSLARATPILLRAGEEASGIDLSTGEPQMYAISGRVIDPEARETGFTLTAVTDGNGLRESAMAMTRFVPASGEFAMALDAGEYTLIAQNANGMGLQHLYVEGDISGVQLILRKRARISGRVVFEGVSARPTNVFVEAASTDSANFRLTASERVGASGTFVVNDVIGTREIRVSQSSTGWTVKSITSGGRSIADVPIDFKGGEDLRDIVIVLSDQIAELDGTVLDPSQHPGVGASVIVFAEDRRQLPRRARWVRPDITGHFVIADLPAGHYLAVAAGDIDETSWQTPEYLDSLRPQAVRVTLAAGAKTAIALTWDPPP